MRNTYVSAASGTVADCVGLADWLAGWLAGWAGWLTCTHDVMTIALLLLNFPPPQVFLILVTSLLL